MSLKNKFFSVLTELARGAKQPMPLEQWERYFKSGTTLAHASPFLAAGPVCGR